MHAKNLPKGPHPTHYHPTQIYCQTCSLPKQTPRGRPHYTYSPRIPVPALSYCRACPLHVYPDTIPQSMRSGFTCHQATSTFELLSSKPLCRVLQTYSSLYVSLCLLSSWGTSVLIYQIVIPMMSSSALGTPSPISPLGAIALDQTVLIAMLWHIPLTQYIVHS